jgi:hypothetical protein
MGGQSKAAGNQEALANNAANNSTATGTGLNATLFGTPTGGATGGRGSTGMSGGTLSGMMDPNSLNVSSPTGPYALQYNQAKAQGATNLAQANQNVDIQAGNAGFGAGAPSGYTGFLKSQNNMANAQNNGQLFSQFAGNSYQDALNNFWKATGMANSTANTQTGQGTSAYTNLYGATPKSTALQNVGSDIAGGVGSAVGSYAGGAAACVCEGTLIFSIDGKKIKVEDLHPGDVVVGIDGNINKVLKVTKHDAQPCVGILTQNNFRLRASKTHTLVLNAGGYVRAGDSKGWKVATRDGRSEVYTLTDIGDHSVYQIFLDGSHSFRSNEIWSLE